MKRLPYGEEFLKWWYEEGGMHNTLFGLDSTSGSSMVSDKMSKAIGPWDAETSPYAEYFDPVFSATVQAYVDRASEVFKLLPKTTFIAEGDSIKYYETDLTGLAGYTYASTPFATGSAESAPTIVSLSQLRPAYVFDPWETSLMSRTEASWQNDPQLDAEWIRRYHTENLPNQLDAMLNKQVDTPASNATSYNIESIDRICSKSDEASTTYCSAATDPDLWWNVSAVKIDRSADTDDTFGGGAGDGIDLPTVGAARTITLEMIDDVVTAITPYSKNRRFIGITGPKTLNEIQRLIDPKQRFLDVPMDYELTMNGVSTRKGAKTGFSVGAYIAGGVEIPFFTTRHVANETSDNRSATVTDANIGNVYILDLDAIELRVAMPVTYLETPPSAMLTGDVLKTRHSFMYAAQLFATNFRSHGAIKYLKS